MYKLIVGKISAERQADWFCNNDNPYAVWEGDALIRITCTIGTSASANEYLRDRVNVDWGSVAWKASKQELTSFFQSQKINISALKALDPGTDYAVVFIETVWGDSA